MNEQEYISDLMSDQKVDLVLYGYPGYVLTRWMELYSVYYSRFVVINEDGAAKIYDSEGVRRNTSITRMFRRTWRNDIENVLPGNKCTMDEIGYPNYTVTRSGKVWSNEHYRWLVPSLSKGYYTVRLSLTNKKRTWSIHQLVARAFHPNPENKPEVNHKDGDKLNNHDWNLEWNTEQENMNHAFDTGLITTKRLLHSQVLEVCKLLDDGLKPIRVAEQLNVPKGTVFKIKRRELYKDISASYKF